MIWIFFNIQQLSLLLRDYRVVVVFLPHLRHSEATQRAVAIFKSKRRHHEAHGVCRRDLLQRVFRLG